VLGGHDHQAAKGGAVAGEHAGDLVIRAVRGSCGSRGRCLV
jgi:hypothetical protein